MTQKEYNKLSSDGINKGYKYSYSVYTGEMGIIFNKWHDGKIDNQEAIRCLDNVYNDGLKEIRKEKHSNIQRSEIRDSFLSLKHFIMYTNQSDSLGSNDNNLFQIMTLSLNFPDFKSDFSKLIGNGYLHETEQGLRWLKSKQSLAEYFRSISIQSKNMPWKLLEQIFHEENLKNSLSSNGSSFKKKSKDYEQWEKIKYP